MTQNEARQLLELKVRGALSKATVEDAYQFQMRQWSTRLNNALTRVQREEAIAVIDLINEAKRIVLLAPKDAKVVPLPIKPVEDVKQAFMNIVAFFKIIWRIIQFPVRVIRCVIQVCKIIMNAIDDTSLGLGIPKSTIVFIICIFLFGLFLGFINAAKALFAFVG